MGNWVFENKKGNYLVQNSKVYFKYNIFRFEKFHLWSTLVTLFEISQTGMRFDFQKFVWENSSDRESIPGDTLGISHFDFDNFLDPQLPPLEALMQPPPLELPPRRRRRRNKRRKIKKSFFVSFSFQLINGVFENVLLIFYIMCRKLQALMNCWEKWEERNIYRQSHSKLLTLRRFKH